MNKKLINEDIVNMKYLFGYKPGRVISEQDFDYTTDDYLDIDDTELDEGGKRHPERLVKHSNTNKLVGTHKHDTGFRPNRHGEELGFDIHSTDIPYGTKFGGVEVGDFDYNDDTELDEDMFDGWEDPDNFKSTLLTKRHKLDLDDEDDDFDFDFLPDENNDHRDEMTEDKDDVFLRRRLSTIEKSIEKYINEVEEEETLFSDEFEFADNIISWVVQDLTTSDYSGHNYDELTDLIKDNFGDYILSQYVEPDFDDDEDTLFEQEEPKTDRYMFFSNLEQIHRQTGILLEKDPNMISEILDNGHDWAQDHIATSKETIDQVFDFLMNEEKGDDDNFLK